VDELDRIGSEHIGNAQKLQDIYPALTALIARDEGLRFLQQFRHLLLGKTRLLPRGHHVHRRLIDKSAGLFFAVVAALRWTFLPSYQKNLAKVRVLRKRPTSGIVTRNDKFKIIPPSISILVLFHAPPVVTAAGTTRANRPNAMGAMKRHVRTAVPSFGHYDSRRALGQSLNPLEDIGGPAWRIAAVLTTAKEDLSYGYMHNNMLPRRRDQLQGVGLSPSLADLTAPAQQLRLLGEIRSHPLRLVLSEQLETARSVALPGYF